MPQRKRIQHVTSEEVQGKGSWVDIAQLTVQDQLDAEDAIRQEGFNQIEYGIMLLEKHILLWNWVNDDGNPMPQISEDAGIIRLLTDEEVKFLGRAIRGITPEEAKN